jgi:hypothetical protein
MRSKFDHSFGYLQMNVVKFKEQTNILWNAENLWSNLYLQAPVYLHQRA